MFTESVNAWCPHEYHIGQADVDQVILEAREGGRWYERGVDGQALRDGIRGGGGWTAILDLYAKAIANDE